MIIIYEDEWETIGRKYLYFNMQQIKTYKMDNICISFIQILNETDFDYWKENKLFSSNTSICWTIERKPPFNFFFAPLMLGGKYICKECEKSWANLYLSPFHNFHPA